MEIWKTLRVSHIPTPPAATKDKCLTRRYTNIPLGTKDRSGQRLQALGQNRPPEAVRGGSRIGRGVAAVEVLQRGFHGCLPNIGDRCFVVLLVVDVCGSPEVRISVLRCDIIAISIA